MKKILLFITVLFSGLMLASCDETTKPTEKPGTEPTASQTDPTVVEEKYDLGGIDFNIVTNIADRYDPRSENYERLFRREKAANVEYVEEKYNIKVNYIDYPSNATWGASRENWIIEQSKLGAANLHVFEVNTNSVANLAVQGAILPLDDLIERFGDEGYWAEKAAFSTILGQVYAYDDTFPIADEGIFYNSDLLAAYLGEERRIEPTQKWLDGEWTWDAFKDLVLELYAVLDKNSEEGPQYVMGGRTYDWTFPFSGSNGALMVNSEFESLVTEEPFLEAVSFLSDLYSNEGLWIDNARLDNTAQPEFVSGNIVFHIGQSWFKTIASKWSDVKFSFEFVPVPVGPRIDEEMSNYFLSNVKGESAFVISSAYSKDNIPEGYEDLMIHDEIIFKIWNDLLHFPALNEDGSYDLEIIEDNFYISRLLKHYTSEESREAHLSIVRLSRPDFFYQLLESQAHTEGSFIFSIEGAIRSGEVRSMMESLHNRLQNSLDTQILGK